MHASRFEYTFYVNLAIYRQVMIFSLDVKVSRKNWQRRIAWLDRGGYSFVCLNTVILILGQFVH